MNPFFPFIPALEHITKKRMMLCFVLFLVCLWGAFFNCQDCGLAVFIPYTCTKAM